MLAGPGSGRHGGSSADGRANVGSAPIEGTGKVSVTTTATSVTFTATSNGYIAEPGSRNTFSTETRGGAIYLQQAASANDANYAVARGVGLGFSEWTWSVQPATSGGSSSDA